MRRQNIYSLLIAASTAVVLTTFTVQQAVTWVPGFYVQQLSVTATTQKSQRVRLAQFVEELAAELAAEGEWTAELSDTVINGWLAVDMPEQFPRLLPPNIRDPRVSIEPGRALIACQYQDGGARAVLSLALDTFVTDKPNEIGLRILSARVGAVPAVSGLIEQAMGAITVASARSGFQIRWIDQQEPPAAVLTIPRHYLQSGQSVKIEQVEFQDGKLRVAGEAIADQNSGPQLVGQTTAL